MQIALIDAIGPFFRDHPGRRINWSKIPFAHLPPTDGAGDEAWRAIGREMDTVAAAARSLGYNAVTLDDVAHLTSMPEFEEEVGRAITGWAERFRWLIRQIRGLRLDVYLTADYLVTSPAIDTLVGEDQEKCRKWFAAQVAACLDQFPEIAGVVLRIGESDGRDVKDRLRSRLVLRDAKGTNRLLRTLLPAFEARGKRLIFRTWTVGAHLIGDLIWNRGRLAAALEGIRSPAFVLSMKHGESDFFRYLPVNRQFFRVEVPCIVEFQARREYEGAGEYPAFIGWEIERLRAELAGAATLVGFSVWCQTGGWHAFRRRAFLEPEAIWIDLNTATIARMMLGGQSVADAIGAFFGEPGKAEAIELLRLADRLVLDALYLPEFARKKLFFRRVRIPPLIHVYWDSIFINAAVRQILGHFTADPEEAIRSGEAALDHFAAMENLASALGLPVEDIRFMRDSFHLMALARRHALLPRDPELETTILGAKAAYKVAWPRSRRQRYRVRISFGPERLNRRLLGWLSGLLIRKRRGYRPLLDQVFTLRILSWCVLFIHARHRKAVPKFLRKSAMGLDTVFR